jgi:spermidine synthase
MSTQNIGLFLVSFVTLYLEIFLIRWISTEVRIFAYVGNLVLLACFLGIGIGCYFSRKKENVLISIGLLAVIALAAQSEVFKQITDLLSGFSDSVVWEHSLRPNNFYPALQGLGLTLFLFLMILGAFVPLGQILGRLLDQHPRVIEGYSVNIVASLIGVWTFNLFSLYYTRPWVWFSFSILILCYFIPRSRNAALFAGTSLAFILLVVGLPQRQVFTLWSPYQKLDISPSQVMGIRNGYLLKVNNTGYMGLLDLSDEFLKTHPMLFSSSLRKFSQYDLPYAFAEKTGSVLILGAGGGNDVAGALRGSPVDVDAVEIDPGIIRLGLALHPERPYENPAVRVTIDDARAFFKKASKKYDIISFGLLDSHTLSSNYNNTRLDHYVYTDESFQDARRLLKKDGILSVIFETQRQWIGERIYALLKKNFGEVPYTFYVRSPDRAYGWGGTMFVTGNNLEQLKKRVESDPELKEFVDTHKATFSGRVRLTTDDWPYLYVEEAQIPRMYLLIIGALLALILLAKKLILTADQERINFQFFFLGCAFLLLEFQNVSKAALLFGSTWVVNSYIISSILILILLANLFVSYFTVRSILPFYGLLWISLLILYMVPLDVFNSLGFWGKTLGASIVLNVPIFFAGIIFIHSFRDTPAKDLALGSNLIGAVFGGLMESLSFIVGIKALLIIALLLYALSFLWGPAGNLRLRAAK